MSISIHNAIRQEYEKRQRTAADLLESRKQQVYSHVPRIEAIDNEVKRLGIRSAKAILMGEEAAEEISARLTERVEELRREKNELLAEAGYSKTYLQPVHTCPQCKDTGVMESQEGSTRCPCYRQLLINHLYGLSNLRQLEYENFEAFNENYYPDVIDEERYGIRKSPRKHVLGVKERCLRFVENFSSPEEKNLYLFGSSGVGKTFLINCIAGELMKKGVTVLYQSAPSLFDAITGFRARAVREDDMEDDIYRSIFDVELLIIDDLGTESQSAARYAELLNILNIRQANNLIRPCKTVISTNIPPEKLYEAYTERVASRIVGGFALHRLVGDDIRHIKTIQGR